MEEYFLLNSLSYKILIWLHLGTDAILKNSFFLIVLPLIVNAVFILLPRFSFGFSRTVKKIFTGGGGIDRNAMPDSFKFAYAYSRNPNLFPNLGKDDAANFFKSLDQKIDTMKTDGGSQGDSSEDSSANLENEIAVTESLGKKDKLYSRLLGGFNLIILSIIFILNIYGFFHYNSLFSNYFEETEKYGYVLNLDLYTKIDNEADKDKVLRMERYVMLLNDVKMTNEKEKAAEKEAEKTQEAEQ